MLKGFLISGRMLKRPFFTAFNLGEIEVADGVDVIYDKDEQERTSGLPCKASLGLKVMTRDGDGVQETGMHRLMIYGLLLFRFNSFQLLDSHTSKLSPANLLKGFGEFHPFSCTVADNAYC